MIITLTYDFKGVTIQSASLRGMKGQNREKGKGEKCLLHWL